MSKEIKLVLSILLILVSVSSIYSQTPDPNDDDNIYYEINIEGPIDVLSIELKLENEIQVNNGKGDLRIIPNGGWFYDNYTYVVYKDGALMNPTPGGGIIIQADGDKVIDDLDFGDYKVELRDSKYPNLSCNSVTSNEIPLINPPLLNISASVSEIIKCKGLQGNITALVKGGVKPVNGNYKVELFKGSSITALQTKYTAYSATIDQPVTFTGLYEGINVETYKIKVTDKYPYPKEVTQDLSQPSILDLPSGNIVTTKVTCYGDSDGTITVTPTGGTIPYKVLLNGIEQTGTFNISKTINSKPAANNYTISIEDANGCKTTLKTGIIVSGPTKRIEVQKDSDANPTFAGASNGFINITVSGGTSPYTYEWFKDGNINSFITTENVSNLEKGIYKVVVTDAKGCTDNLTVTLIDPQPLTVQPLSKTDVNCFGGNDGTLTANASGGASNTYRHEWSKNNGGVWNLIEAIATSNTSQINVSAGEYKVKVIVLLSGVEVEDSEKIKIVGQPSEPLKIVETINDASCKSDSNGSIQLNVSGGTPIYTYEWSNGAKTKDINGLSKGSYTVTIKDANSCILEQTYTITEPTDELNVTLDNSQDPLSFNGTDGNINISVTGGNGNYTYKWTNSLGSEVGTSEDISGIGAGNYKLVVTDKKGCTDTLFETLDQPDKLIATVSIPTDGILFCNGDSDGKLEVSVEGGLTPYKYHWYEVLSNGSKSFLSGKTNSTVQGLDAGEYGIEVTDRNGAGIKAFDGKMLSEPNKIEINTPIITHVKCKGFATGSIDIDVIGGTGNYKYKWYKVGNNTIISTTKKIVNKKAGQYKVLVQDTNNCPSTPLEKTITIEEPLSGLSVTSSTVVDASGFGLSNGSITVTVVGGSPFDASGSPYYTYSLTEKSTGLVKGTSKSVTGLLGSVSGIVYEMTITDTNGCKLIKDYTIEQPEELLLSLSLKTGIRCNGEEGVIESTVAGGFLSTGSVYSYKWYKKNALSTTIGGLETLTAKSGEYRLVVEDSKGNTAFKDFELEENEEVLLSYTRDNVDCYSGSNGSIDLTVTGGTGVYTYVWSNGLRTQDLISLTKGDYKVTVSDENGCSKEETITIEEPLSGLSVTSSTVVDASGFGLSNGSITVTVVGGSPFDASGSPYYTYSLTEKSTGLVKGTSKSVTGLLGSVSGIVYEMTITDANGCKLIKDYTIEQPEELLLSLSLKTGIRCNGEEGVIESTVAGGFLSTGSVYSYKWYKKNALSTTIGGLETLTAKSGEYRLVVEDSKGNTAFKDFELEENEEVLLSYTRDNVDCYSGSNGSIDLTVTGGTGVYTYVWSNGLRTQDLTSLTKGDYKVTVSDENGCSKEETITIEEPLSGLSVTSSTVVDASGFGLSNGSITVTVVGGSPFDASGSPYYTYSLTEKSTGLVKGTSKSVTGLLGSVSGIVYEMTITDANGCKLIKDYTIEQPEELLLSLSLKTGIRCNGEEGVIESTVAGGFLSTGSVYSYKWYKKNALSTTIGGLETLTAKSGEYRLVVEDSKGNTAFKDFELEENEEVLLSYTRDNVDCYSGSNGSIDLTVTGGTGVYTYVWSNGLRTQDLISLTKGDYKVTVSDENGCSKEETITIEEPLSGLSVTSSTVVDASGFGLSNGSITVTVVGGSPFDASGSPYYTYSLTEKSTGLVKGTSKSVTGLLGSVSGIVYEMTITDANGCKLIKDYTIEQPEELLLSLSLKTGIRCNGEEGVIESTVAGGFLSTGSVYSYKWYKKNALSTTIGGLETLTAKSGEYRLVVEDSKGNTAFKDFELEENEEVLLSYTRDNVDCYSGSNGSIDLTVTGGTGVYTYVWSNGLRTQDLTSLTKGDYKVTVSDENGCSKEETITIEEPLSGLSVTSSTVVDASGFGLSNGSITVTVVGGSPFDASGSPYYTYSLTEKSTGLVKGTSKSVTGLLGSVSGIVYEMTITDANGCKLIKDYTIEQPEELLLSLSLKTGIRCNGEEGVIESTVAGGFLSTGSVYSYKWYKKNALSTTIGGLETLTAKSGEYRLVVEDSKGNTAFKDFELEENEEVLLSYTRDNVDCYSGSNGSIDLTVTGGTGVYTYVWSNGLRTQDLISLTKGDYKVTVSDENGCSKEETITIEEPLSGLSVTSSTVVDASGFGLSNGSITVTVVGGSPFDASGSPYYTYSLTEKSTGLVKGTSKSVTGLLGSVSGIVYEMTITDANGCKLIKDYTIEQPEELLLSLSLKTGIRCNGEEGVIESTVAGGFLSTGSVYSYKWYKKNALSTTIGGLETLTAKSGEYRLVVEDSKGNTAFKDFELEENEEVLLSYTRDDVNCYSGNTGSIDLTVTGGTGVYTYVWSNGLRTQDLTSLTKGDYKVTVSDENGCSKEETITIEEPDEYKILINIFKRPSGAGLSDGEIAVEILGGTKPYILKWEDDKGNIISNINSISNILAGKYTLLVTDVKGCVLKGNYDIGEPDKLLISIKETSSIRCHGDLSGVLELETTGGVGGNIYTWYNGTTNAVIGNTESISNLGSGSYSVKVVDANGIETISSTYVLSEPTLITTTSSSNNLSCFESNNGSIELSTSGGVGAYFYRIKKGNSVYGTWISFTSTVAIDNLPSDTYQVQVKDSSDCYLTNNGTIEVLEFLITQPLLLEVTEAITDVTGFGLSNGSVSLVVSGGTTPYSYSWRDISGTEISTSKDLNNVISGTYTLELRDSNNCVVNETYIINQPDKLLISIKETSSIRCHGDLSGVLELETTGGFGGNIYTWYNGTTNAVIGNTESISNLGSGSYSVKVVDANGIETISNTYVLSEPTLITTTSSSNNLSCFESNNGSIELSTSGGVGAYFYRIKKGNSVYGTWISFTSTVAIDNLPSDTYQVQVKDSSDCYLTNNGTIEILEFLITQPLLLEVTETITDVTGFGLSNGSVSLVVSGGTTPYSYLWKDVAGAEIATSKDLNNVISGTYTLELRDSNNCVVNDTYIINQPEELLISIKETSSIRCHGDLSGVLELETTGGVGGNIYTWYNATTNAVIGNTESISNLGSGSYSVKVVDANGIETISNTYVLSEPTLITTTSSSNNLSCFESNNGSIELSTSGGVGAYFYRIKKGNSVYGTWISFTSTVAIDNLPSDTYQVQVKDSSDCYLTNNGTIEILEFLITQPLLLEVTETITDVTGFGLSNGSVSLVVSGGTTPYSYLWKDVAGAEIATSKDLNNVISGTYTLELRDSNNCVVNDTYIINQPEELLISIKETSSIRCHGDLSGGLELETTGGVGGNIYTWYNATTNAVIGNTESISNLGSGSYSVKVVDANGIETISNTYVLSEPTLITTTSSFNNLSCFESNNGSIELSTSGGVGAYFYRIKKGNSVYGTWISFTSTVAIDNLPSDTYQVQVKDSSDCYLTNNGTIEILEFLITQPLLLEVTETITDVTGFGLSNGSVSLVVSGGTTPYSYLWKDVAGAEIATSKDLNNVISGTYTLELRDSNNCVVNDTYIINQPEELLISIKETSSIRCHGDLSGVLELETTGGVGGNIYTWYNATTNAVIGNTESISNLGSGSYSVKVVDANGIETISNTYVLSEPTLITTTSSFNNLSCFESNNGSIELSTSGGVGAYFYRIKKGNSVYGTWISFTSTVAIDNLPSDTYQVQVKDSSDCYLTNNGTIEILEFLITQPLLLEVTETITDITGFGLSNGSVSLVVSGGITPYSYLWKDVAGAEIATSKDLNNVISGTYTLELRDSNNCVVNDTYIINQPEQLTVNIEQENIVLCNGDLSASIISVVNGGILGYNYSWYNKKNETEIISSETSLRNIGEGTYYLIIIDSKNNVTKSKDIIITEPDVLNLKIESTPGSCGTDNDWTIIANVTGGTLPYKYFWNTGATTKSLTNISLGNYFVLITDANGCKTTQNIVIENSSPLVINTNVTDVICYNSCTGAIDLEIEGGVAPYTTVWNTGETGSSIANLCHGEYIATVTDKKGCTIIKNITIKNAEEFIFEIVPNEVTLCYGETIEYDVTMNGVSEYSWVSTNGFTSNKSIVTLSEGGKYTLKVTTDKGCSISREIEIFKSEVKIDAQLILTSQAFVGEDIAIINVSNPISSNIEWNIPRNVTIVQKTDEGLILRFPAPGNYDITLVATEGNCKKTETKTVTVLKARDLNDVGDTKNPFIKEFKVYSNPNNGKFKVDIELEKEAEVSLRLFSLSANAVVADKSLKGLKEYKVDYDLNLSAGIYVLLLETPKVKRIRKIIIE